MNYKERVKQIRELKYDIPETIYENDTSKLYVVRPSKLPKRLKNKYDKSVNFQIWIKEGEREFKPNHMRLFLDLNLRIRSKPELKSELCTTFDNIFYGADPKKETQKLSETSFAHYLNDLVLIGYLAQLFLIEQDINYNRESKFEPPTLFFQGWVREFIDSPKEIDNMCMSVARGQPPKVQYTNLENMKHKKYQEERSNLWYLSD